MADDAPSTKMETLLAEIWSEVLKVDGIKPTDTFIDLGGDSLDALMVISKVEKAIGIKLDHERHFVSSLQQVAEELERMVAAKG